MKKALISAMVLLATSQAFAIRALHKLFPVAQPDGTEVMLYKYGNDGLAYYGTPDGLVVVRDDEGTLRYAELKDGQLRPTAIRVHDAGARTPDELAYAASTTLNVGNATVRQMGQASKVAPQRIGASTADGLGRYMTSAGGAVPSIGTVKIPVVMVAFADCDFQPGVDVAKMQRYLTEDGYKEESAAQCGSVKEYFVDQSRGLFTPEFTVVAKVTLDNGYATYGRNGSNGRGDIGVMNMIREAIQKAVDQGVDFSQYYHGTLNRVPNISFFYAGPGEASGGNENRIWPHESDLSGGLFKYVTIAGYNFASYFVGNEVANGEGGTELTGAGTFVHEFSHALGLPDFYVTDYSYSNDSPFGIWDIMDGGPYRGAYMGYAPSGYSAYERSFMGWLDLKELHEPEAVTLASQRDAEGDFARLIRNPNNENEYWTIENRQAGKWWDGSGLMISHYAYSASEWNGNVLNNVQSRKRAHLVSANGRTSSYNAEAGSLFGNGVNALAQLPLYGGGSLSGHEILKVLSGPNGTVTFNYRDATIKPASAGRDGTEWRLVEAIDDLQSGDSVIIANAEEYVAIAGRTQNSARAATLIDIDGSTAFGNSNVERYAIQQSRTTGNWAFRNNEGMYISSASTGLVMTSRTGANMQAEITITDGMASVVFGGTYARKYLGFDTENAQFTCFTSDPRNILLYKKATASGIALPHSTARQAQPAAIYTVTGQYVGTTLAGLPAGVYVQGGRKVVVK